jgi:hypothetical protein
MRAGSVLTRTQGGRSKVTVWALPPAGTDVSTIRVSVEDTGKRSGRATVKIRYLVKNELLNAQSLLCGYPDPELERALQEALDTGSRSERQQVEAEQSIPLPAGVQVETVFRTMTRAETEDSVAWITIVQLHNESRTNAVVIWSVLYVATKDKRPCCSAG